MSKIPKSPAWCSGCITGDAPCEYHRDNNGEARDYEGHDAYEPSEWVLGVVGRRYTYDDEVYECFGYDPRNGFWMLAVDGERLGRKTNVSERAIGSTFYLVEMTFGARAVLMMHVALERTPTKKEMTDGGAHPEYAPRTLQRLGLIDTRGITKAGREEAAREWPR